MAVIGKVIGGTVGGKVVIRLHSEHELSVGDLLVVKDNGKKFFVKVVDLGLTSLIPEQFIEDIAGQKLEYNIDFKMFDEKDRFYKLCQAKILKIQTETGFESARIVPNHFSSVYPVEAKDFVFLKNKGEIPIGNLRLGRDSLKDVVISLPSNKLISHHMLVVAATGKGKSNFAKVFARGLLFQNNTSAIIIDPHGEYHGARGNVGLKDHHKRDKVLLFTPRFKEFPGSEPLMLYAEDLEPQDFHGIIDLSGAQIECMSTLQRLYGKQWLCNLIEENVNTLIEDTKQKIFPGTFLALRRKLSVMMGLEGKKGLVFSLEEKQGETSIFQKIKKQVSQGRIIIIDTSLIGDEAEKLVSSSIVSRMLSSYQYSKQKNPSMFETLPELLIVFEEAPRVLGKEALSKGTNIFERVAREGRKFKVGLCAITQMPSLLPREILSQMNTKVILGLPSPADREAVINSSSHDISDERTEIQMLNKGESIIVSPFIEFPLPVKIFYFNDVIKQDNQKSKDSPSSQPSVFGLG